MRDRLLSLASFIYWQSLQDNMNIGLVKNVSSSSAFYTQNTFVEMHFDFQPGFKIGAGMNVQNDGWDIYAEYTTVYGNQTRIERFFILSDHLCDMDRQAAASRQARFLSNLSQAGSGTI